MCVLVPGGRARVLRSAVPLSLGRTLFQPRHATLRPAVMSHLNSQSCSMRMAAGSTPPSGSSSSSVSCASSSASDPPSSDCGSFSSTISLAAESSATARISGA